MGEIITIIVFFDQPHTAAALSFRPQHILVVVVVVVVIIHGLVVVGPVCLYLATVAVAGKAIIISEPALPVGIVEINGEITQADFPALGNIVDHPDDEVSGRGRGRGLMIQVIEPAGIREAIVVEERGSWINTVGPDRSIALFFFRERFHQTKGVEFVLSQQSGRQLGAKFCC